MSIVSSRPNAKANTRKIVLAVVHYIALLLVVKFNIMDACLHGSR